MSNTCTHDPCERPSRRNGRCDTHDAQFKTRGTTWDIHGKPPGTPCNWEGCESITDSSRVNRCITHRGKCSINDGHNWCARTTIRKSGEVGDVCPMHSQRLHESGDYGPVSGHRNARTDRSLDGERRSINNSGYVTLSVRDFSGKLIKRLEHRVVMEEYLGRPLLPEETVHHLNGDKTNNSLKNLQLWASRHPRGMRILDLIEYANEILAEYGDYVEPGSIES